MQVNAYVGGGLHIDVTRGRDDFHRGGFRRPQRGAFRTAADRRCAAAVVGRLAGMSVQEFGERYRPLLAAVEHYRKDELHRAVVAAAARRTVELELVLLAEVDPKGHSKDRGPSKPEDRLPIHLHFDAIDARIRVRAVSGIYRLTKVGGIYRKSHLFS